MLVGGGAGDVRRVGVYAGRREQREVASPIHPKHPPTTPAHSDGPVEHVGHCDDPTTRDGEAGRDAMTGADAQRHDAGGRRNRRGASAEQAEGRERGRSGNGGEQRDGGHGGARWASGGPAGPSGGLAGHHGARADVARTTSVGSATCISRFCRPSTRSSSSSRATRPISGRGWLMVVSDMWCSAARNVLS